MVNPEVCQGLIKLVMIVLVTTYLIITLGIPPTEQFESSHDYLPTPRSSRWFNMWFRQSDRAYLPDILIKTLVSNRLPRDLIKCFYPP